MEIKRGEVFYADLSPVIGSEQGGTRPVVIIQNDVGNKYSPTVIAAAITSQQDKAKLPTHISVEAEGSGLQKNSIVLLEQVRTIATDALTECLDNGITDWTELKGHVKDDLSKFLYTKTKRKPMILPVVMNV